MAIVAALRALSDTDPRSMPADSGRLRGSRPGCHLGSMLATATVGVGVGPAARLERV